jgi:hypothetical protein
MPPGGDRRYTECYGFSLEDIYAFGLRSVRAKWRAAGFPIEEMPPGVFPLDPGMEPEQHAKRMIALLEAGVLGEPNGRPDSSPEVQRFYFETVQSSVNHDAVKRPITIQWKFTDAAPWHLRIDNGSTEAAQGEAPGADLTLEASWEDWITATVGGGDPRRMMLRRRIRPHGSLRTLAQLPKIFPARYG